MWTSDSLSGQMASHAVLAARMSVCAIVYRDVVCVHIATNSVSLTETLSELIQI